jgi:4-hydroxythreonine-4-phosphate dehydrogenase
MNNICILLTDNLGINQEIIIKSLSRLKKSKVKKIYFIGDQKLFSKLNKKIINNSKFIFIHYHLQNKNYYKYLREITIASIKLFKEKKIKMIINMPLNKKKFLRNRFLGYTEFFSYYLDNKKNENMLLFNKKFSVCPLTTHEQLKNVEKKINKKKLFNAINNIDNFYKKIIKKDVQIVVLGLNPHASQDLEINNKDINLIKPTIDFFKKKKINIVGPVSSDTAFLKTKGKVYLGMYHDQVLIPFKTLNGFNGINITIGKKIIRISPDHGTGNNLKNNHKLISNRSFIECLKFSETINV